MCQNWESIIFPLSPICSSSLTCDEITSEILNLAAQKATVYPGT